ncbi:MULTISPECIES: 5-demethoxyubiquinol-8 5-hydroxylase UbiM [Comamonas]|jgi:ubiquinone biosynthesis UbiH/UbiF/VisC/COQ6 family hydroxylase|uniref:Ubiquinone biosynthesis protein UbiH n=1 Tax=Comamonas terrigena TaxID=32013 RepID=A0A2A7UR87_COMTR|nr:5-demethoxyubiquinol-8 5-hydroxylase UbiM [Comamonas terrigena]MBD9532907.1 5-demethoxyubiquinol-8 5-hydroxylase UbiM [Comamonas sp. CMM01]PEH87726.1 ubiquinone biosynthesis protein UbiH [Comamonas terrigena]
MSMHTDALIVGAGPAGLSLAISLAQAGLQVTVLEQQPALALQQPKPDGREIALTHPSVQTLQRLGSWELLQPHEQGQIREAQIHDGPVGQRPMLAISADGSGVDQLGRIVPNHALRRTAWEVASTTPGVEIITEAQVTAVSVHPCHAEVRYTRTDQGVRCEAPALTAPLVVAADSRFSGMRRLLGVGAQMTDFGRSVIVCRMRHTLPHEDIAHECFGYERTLAILPLQPDPDTGELLCSAVITTDSADAQRLLQLSPEDFAAHVQHDFQDRLGPMELVGERHSYPLVATYAHRFSGARWALLGDAAVGMHPVTAHGFNLGLAGVERLTAAVAAARQAGQDWGDAAVLDAYAQGQHRHAFPIFAGTNSIVKLYTDARPLPRVLRQVVLTGARHLPPLKAAIAAQLTGRSPWQLIRATLPQPPWAGRH